MTLPTFASLLAALVANGAPPHTPEERMEFSIDYLGVPMGRARIQVGKPEGELLPVFLEAKTSGFMSMFTIREQLATYLDSETGLPRSATLDAVEPGYKHYDRTEFDRVNNRAKVRQVGKYDNTDVVDVPEGALDFVAMVFKLRTLPLPDGQKHEFPVLSGKTVRHVVAEVVARERVKTDAGTFPAVKVKAPLGFTGKFSEKNPTFIWFTDDARRIVVKIVTDFGIGGATAELTKYVPGSPEQSAGAAARSGPG